jgi:hypothetical protein
MADSRDADLFWARVGIRGSDDCWPWLGATNTSGYGAVAWAGVTYTAHRVAAWLCGLVGSPSMPEDRIDGLILHSCDNPPCCNPAHFEVGTSGKNQVDAYARGRRQPLRGGVDHPVAKLLPDQVRAIRQEYATGHKTQKELASQYGVNQVSISHAVRRETYAWIS